MIVRVFVNEKEFNKIVAKAKQDPEEVLGKIVDNAVGCSVAVQCGLHHKYKKDTPNMLPGGTWR